MKYTVFYSSFLEFISNMVSRSNDEMIVILDFYSIPRIAGLRNFNYRQLQCNAGSTTYFICIFQIGVLYHKSFIVI